MDLLKLFIWFGTYHYDKYRLSEPLRTSFMHQGKLDTLDDIFYFPVDTGKLIKWQKVFTSYN